MGIVGGQRAWGCGSYAERRARGEFGDEDGDADVLSLGLKSKKEVADAIVVSFAEEFQKYRAVCVGKIGGVIKLPLEGRREAETETAR